MLYPFVITCCQRPTALNIPDLSLGKHQLWGMKLSSCQHPPECHTPAQSDAGLYTHSCMTHTYIHTQIRWQKITEQMTNTGWPWLRRFLDSQTRHVEVSLDKITKPKCLLHSDGFNINHKNVCSRGLNASRPLFSVEDGKDLLAGHEALLQISQLQVVQLQHVLLLFLLIKHPVMINGETLTNEINNATSRHRPSYPLADHGNMITLCTVLYMTYYLEL